MKDLLEAAKNVLETNVPSPRVSKEIHYKTKGGEERVSEVSAAKEAEEVRTIKALGGRIIKVNTVTH